MCDMLAKYKDEVGVYDVYTMIKKDDKDFTRFVLASYNPDSTFMQRDIYNDKMRQAFEGKISITDKPFSDDFGTFYTAYSPLYNSNGEIVAIIGVDMSLNDINNVKKQLIKQYLLLILFLIFSNILAYFISIKISKNYLGIMKKINSIKNGDKHLLETLESEVVEIEDITESVTQLENMAQKLNSKLDNIKTFNKN